MEAPGFDRNAFKASSISVNKESETKVEGLVGSNSKKNADFLQITPGYNYFRLYPPHPTKDEKGHPFAQPRCTSTVPIIVDETDDKGNKTGRKKQTIKHVFNAKVHGGFKKDIIEEYIRLVFKKGTELYGEKLTPAKEEYQKYIYGVYKGKGSRENISGILFQTKYICYANKMNDKGDVEKFGRLEFGKGIKNSLNDISAVESAQQSISVDPFTDPENGLAIAINYNPDGKTSTDYYKVALYTPRISATEIKIFKLSDAELMAFMNAPSLYESYTDVYTKRDFELAMKGLELLEKTAGYGIFESDEFMEIALELQEELPEPPTQEPQQAEADKDLPFGEGGAPVETVKPVQSIPEPPKSAAPVIPPPVAKVEEPIKTENPSFNQQVEVQPLADDDKAARLAAMKAKMGFK